MQNAVRLASVVLFAFLAAEEVSLDRLLQLLHGNASPEQEQTMRAFARQASAPEAIPRLLEVLKSEAPEMDNNVCLTLGFIFNENPEAKCPVEPLLDVVERRIWTSQQKGAQALYYLLRPENVAGVEERVAHALVPLTTSQRMRVFQAGTACLERLSGEKHGPDPAAWKAWFQRRFGKPIDLSNAVYEIVLVVRPLGEKPPMDYEVNGEKVSGVDGLKTKVGEHTAKASARKLPLGAVVQVPNEVMERITATLDTSTVDEALAILRRVSPGGVTVSPASDVFRLPYEEKAASGR